MKLLAKSIIYGEEDADESKDEIGYETKKMDTKQNNKADDGKRSSRLDALQADTKECFGPRIWRGCQASQKNQGTRLGKKNAGEFQVR